MEALQVCLGVSPGAGESSMQENCQDLTSDSTSVNQCLKLTSLTLHIKQWLQS